MAVNRQCPDGARGPRVSWMSDHGSQPTSMAFMQAWARLGSPHAFTSDNNPQGNADTERAMRTLTEESLGLREWTCPFALIRTLGGWIAYSNAPYLHAALGDKLPGQYERDSHRSHRPPFIAA